MNSFSPLPSSVEVDHFTTMADEWWNPRGPFRALHELMPLRERYVLDQIFIQKNWKTNETTKKTLPLKGVRLLDIGCGGGLMSEAMARLGAHVIGLDPSAKTIDIARRHAALSGLSIDYRVGHGADSLQGEAPFDVILAFEIAEHVANLGQWTGMVASLLKPGGLLIASTLNRTRRSFLLGVVVAEYMLGWVPAGTHHWEKFVKPSEMAALWTANGLRPVDLTGLVYKPLTRRFEWAKGRTAVNYFMAGRKEGKSGKTKP